MLDESLELVMGSIEKQTMKKIKEQGAIPDIFFIVYIPAPAILLEYLIVR